MKTNRVKTCLVILAFKDSKLVLDLSLKKAWITSKTWVSRRLDWPGRLPALAKPGFVFAKNSRAKIVHQQRAEGAADGHNACKDFMKIDFSFSLLLWN